MDIQNLSVDQVNEALEDKLSNLKSASEQRAYIQVRALAGELNDILYSAIIHHTPHVNAVQVQTMADVSRECRDLPNWGRREAWKTYVQLVRQQDEIGGKIKGTVPFLFTAHLPFSFTTGTHGSGERNAMGASSENLEFEALGSSNYVPVAFKARITGSSCFLSNDCYFLPQEVISLKLAKVDDQKFSPLYKGMHEQLESSPSALEHYLFFRGFISYLTTTKHVPEEEWKQKIVSLMPHITIPDTSTGLFVRHWDTNEISGFATLRTYKGIKVYEFDRVLLPFLLLNDNNAFSNTMLASAAYAIELHKDDPQPNIRIYQGNDAITRLHEFKPKRQF